MAHTDKYLTGNDIAQNITKYYNAVGTFVSQNSDENKYISRKYFDDNIVNYEQNYHDTITGTWTSISDGTFHFGVIDWENIKFFACHYTYNPSISNNDYYDTNKQILIKDGEIYYWRNHDNGMRIEAYPLDSLIGGSNYYISRSADNVYNNEYSCNTEISISLVDSLQNGHRIDTDVYTDRWKRFYYYYYFNNLDYYINKSASSNRQLVPISIEIPCGYNYNSNAGIWKNFYLLFDFEFYRLWNDQTSETLYPEPYILEAEIENESNWRNAISASGYNTWFIQYRSTETPIINPASMYRISFGLLTKPTVGTTKTCNIMLRNFPLIFNLNFVNKDHIRLYLIKVTISRSFGTWNSNHIDTLKNTVLNKLVYTIEVHGGGIWETWNYSGNESQINSQINSDFNSQHTIGTTYNSTISHISIGGVDDPIKTIIPYSSDFSGYASGIKHSGQPTQANCNQVTEYSNYLYVWFPDYHPINSGTNYNTYQDNRYVKLSFPNVNGFSDIEDKLFYMMVRNNAAGASVGGGAGWAADIALENNTNDTVYNFYLGMLGGWFPVTISSKIGCENITRNYSSVSINDVDQAYWAAGDLVSTPVIEFFIDFGA